MPTSEDSELKKINKKLDKILVEISKDKLRTKDSVKKLITQLLEEYSHGNSISRRMKYASDEFGSNLIELFHLLITQTYPEMQLELDQDTARRIVGFREKFKKKYKSK